MNRASLVSKMARGCIVSLRLIQTTQSTYIGTQRSLSALEVHFVEAAMTARLAPCQGGCFVLTSDKAESPIV